MQKIFTKDDGWLKLTLDLKVYPLSTIYSAGYVFLDRAYIHLDMGGKGKVEIRLLPKNKKVNLNRLGMDFYNELLNYAHYHSRIKANTEVIKMIMQRALFSVNPSVLADTDDRKVDKLINELEKEKVVSKKEQK
jgi:His-Xaa-Ser system protein HxsD